MRLARDSSKLLTLVAGLSTCCQSPLRVCLAPSTHPSLGIECYARSAFAGTLPIENRVLAALVPAFAKLSRHPKIVLAVLLMRYRLNMIRSWSEAASIMAGMMKFFSGWHWTYMNTVRDYVGPFLHTNFVGAKPIPKLVVASRPFPAAGSLYDLVVEPLLECFSVSLGYVAGMRTVALPLPPWAGKFFLADRADSDHDGHVLSLQQRQEKVKKGV